MGWQLCDGTLLSIAANGALFQLLGTSFGGGISVRRRTCAALLRSAGDDADGNVYISARTEAWNPSAHRQSPSCCSHPFVTRREMEKQTLRSATSLRRPAGQSSAGQSYGRHGVEHHQLDHRPRGENRQPYIAPTASSPPPAFTHRQSSWRTLITCLNHSKAKSESSLALLPERWAFCDGIIAIQQNRRSFPFLARTTAATALEPSPCPT